jgi:dTDP-glucose 4,6-dehydratase
LARAKGAGLLMASTSEVYGDPLVHPQEESYFGNVNPIGPRGCYDEAKRFAEAMSWLIIVCTTSTPKSCASSTPTGRA